MPHPASAGGLPSLGLLGPVEVPHASGWVDTGGAYFLLDMESSPPTPWAKGVGLIMPLSKT